MGVCIATKALYTRFCKHLILFHWQQRTPSGSHHQQSFLTAPRYHWSHAQLQAGSHTWKVRSCTDFPHCKNRRPNRGVRKTSVITGRSPESKGPLCSGGMFDQSTREDSVGADRQIKPREQDKTKEGGERAQKNIKDAVSQPQTCKLINEIIDHFSGIKPAVCHLNSIPVYARWCEITTRNHIIERNSTINLRGSDRIPTIYALFFIVFKLDFFFSSVTMGNGIWGIAVRALLHWFLFHIYLTNVLRDWGLTFLCDADETNKQVHEETPAITLISLWSHKFYHLLFCSWGWCYYG